MIATRWKFLIIMAAALFLLPASFGASFSVSGTSGGLVQSSTAQGSLGQGSSYSGQDVLSFGDGLSMSHSSTASIVDGSDLSKEWRAEDPGVFAAYSGYSVDSADAISMDGGFAIKPGSSGSSWEKGSVVNGVNPNFYAVAENTKGYYARAYIDPFEDGSRVSMTYSNAAKVGKDTASATQLISNAQGCFIVGEEAGYFVEALGDGGTVFYASDRMGVSTGVMKTAAGTATSSKGGALTSLKASVASAAEFASAEHASYEQGTELDFLMIQAETTKSAIQATGIVYTGSTKATSKECTAIDQLSVGKASDAGKTSNAHWNQYVVWSMGAAGSAMPTYAPSESPAATDAEGPVVTAVFKDTASSKAGTVSLSEAYKASGTLLMRMMGTDYYEDYKEGTVRVFTTTEVGGDSGISSLEGTSTISYNDKMATLSGSFKGNAAPKMTYRRNTVAGYYLGEPVVPSDPVEDGGWLEAFIAAGKPGVFSFKEFAKATSDGVVLDAY
jgi:hypothetical protein